MKFVNKKLEEFNNYIKGKKVAIIGLGVSNIPLIDELYKLGANITLFNNKDVENLDKTILDKTSTDALGAYLQTVMRLSARRDVTAPPKGMKINEAPKQEPIAKNSIDTTSMMIEYLKGKQ